MDNLTERDIAPSVGTDAVSELLPLLQSEEWQKRLEAARLQRERILAERGPAPELPPRPMMPRLEVVPPAPQSVQPLPRIEPLSGLRAGPVPRTETYPAEEEEFEEFDDISVPPPRPLPGLRVVPPSQPAAQPEVMPIPPTPVPAPAEASVAAVSIPAVPLPAALTPPKPWLTTRKIAGGFALGIAIGLGFSLSSFVTSRLTVGTAPEAVFPASPNPVEPVAPAAAVAPQAAAHSDTDVADLSRPQAGTVPATPGVLTGSVPDSAPQVPVAITGPVQSAQPQSGLALASDAPPQIAPPAAMASVTDATSAPAPAAAASDEAVPHLASPVALSPLLGPKVLGIAVQPDALPLASTGPDAILAATNLTSLAALAPPEISAVLPGAGIAPARLAAPLAGGTPAPDTELTLPEAPPALAPVEVQLVLPTGIAESKAQETTQLVAAAGFLPARTSSVDVKIKATHVRYYHEEDRLLAERLAAAAGGTARSFIGSKNSPAEGVVELWLAGAPDAAAVAKKPAAAKPAKAAKPKKQQTAAAKPATPRPAASDPIQAKKSAIAEKFSLEKFN